MAKTNGHAEPTAAETSPFVFGGQTVNVPIMQLQDLAECKELMLAMDAGMTWIDYALSVTRVVAHQLVTDGDRDANLADRQPKIDEKFAELSKACTAGEASDVAIAMNQLLRASGFRIPEATPSPEPTTEAANPGTGTSTLSPPSSPAETSAEVTRTG